MKVAIVAETYLPTVNGVSNSVSRVLEQLKLRGDTALVIAPSTTSFEEIEILNGVTIIRLPSMPLATYASIRVAFGTVARVRRILADFAPDVVHLAAPFELGWRAARAANQLGLPIVAIYQTDLGGYMSRYGVPFLENLTWQRIERIHELATRTLAPSSAARNQLQDHSIPRVHLWGRGVDTGRFHPARRDRGFRAEVAPNGERLIGYVGRLAAEKQVEDLAVLADIPNSRLVIVGDGPLLDSLQRALPTAHFTGFLGGDDLARVMASLDVFVHPGELETFCQTIQEAMASGLPVVATGSGGPLDLVDSSRTGWLYEPGNLGELRSRVVDLVGDDAKRAALASAAFERVQEKTWPAIVGQLRRHYKLAMREHAFMRVR